jgi:hypothetical protein
MGNGGYNGGSTVIRPGSDWFEEPDAKPERRKPVTLEELARSAAASADRAEKRRKDRQNLIAAFNKSPDAVRKAAIRRVRRKKAQKHTTS